MPEPVKRPTPFLALLIASVIFRFGGAMWLAFGLVQLFFVWYDTRPKFGVRMGMAWGANLTWLLVQSALIVGAGDLAIAVVDIHRDLRIARERLEGGKPPTS